MNFTRKASITLTAAASAAEIVAAARAQPGFDQVLVGAAKRVAESAGSTSGLGMVSGAVTFTDDGSATIDLVYEPTVTDADAASAPQPDQPIVFNTQVN